MTCLTCTNWSPRRAGGMARHGFGCCAHLPDYTTTAPIHKCKQHRSATDAVTKGRTEWLHKIDAKAAKQPAGALKQEMKGKA